MKSLNQQQPFNWLSFAFFRCHQSHCLYIYTGEKLRHNTFLPLNSLQGQVEGCNFIICLLATWIIKLQSQCEHYFLRKWCKGQEIRLLTSTVVSSCDFVKEDVACLITHMAFGHFKSLTKSLLFQKVYLYFKV